LRLPRAHHADRDADDHQHGRGDAVEQEPSLARGGVSRLRGDERRHSTTLPLLLRLLQSVEDVRHR
jgi:hypothetical protein